MMLTQRALSFLSILPFALSAPPGFPSSGNGLWFTHPGTIWSTEYLPVGNGFLAAMTSGGTSQETTQLNIESLWSGGPFADPSYNGGNKQPSERPAMAQAMHDIRQTIFQSPTGDIPDIEVLAADAGAYGSYAGAGYLVTTLNVSGAVSGYARWLDLDQGIARTAWTQDGNVFTRDLFCSRPTRACVQHTAVAAGRVLPAATYAFSAAPEAGLPGPNVSCLDSSTLLVRGLVAEPGMLYELLARVHTTGGNIACTPLPGAANATVSVTGASEAWVAWVGGTDYDMAAGDAAHSFTFRGADPHESLAAQLATASASSYAALRSAHTANIAAAQGGFSLSLGQTPDLNTPTDARVAAYAVDEGDPYLEWLLFNYGRYLLISSARGALPANLQGKWADGISNPWSADANINLQMNYWSAEMGALTVTESLFDYMEKTWAPRGALTAQVLYNISRGWVTHDEMNIFGHTGMKAGGNTAMWSDYPESAVWMMIHAWDHFDYTGDTAWWRATGYPLVKGVAAFHLDRLIPDAHANDGTLVTAPCNSPEQAPITLGCAHAQQLIWQLFNAVERGFGPAGDTDTAFLEEVRTARLKMDKGVRIGSWGQLQEWKIERDQQNDTHRHLSHLVGLYPGYAVAGYDPALQGGARANGALLNYTTQEVLRAAEVSLVARGNGTGSDADSGWEKVWRAACWAQLGNATNFYHELTYALYENFAPNLFSLYDPSDADPIFQIGAYIPVVGTATEMPADANLGFPAAVLNALLQAPETADAAAPLTLTLLPALPTQWSTGALNGARVRGGVTVDFSWANGQPTRAVLTAGAGARGRSMRVVWGGKEVGAFTATPGKHLVIGF